MGAVGSTRCASFEERVCLQQVGRTHLGGITDQRAEGRRLVEQEASKFEESKRTRERQGGSCWKHRVKTRLKRSSERRSAASRFLRWEFKFAGDSPSPYPKDSNVGLDGWWSIFFGVHYLSAFSLNQL